MTEPINHEPLVNEVGAPELNNQETEHFHPEPPAVQWPEAPNPTGDPLVDKAMGLLDGVTDAPVAEHGELYARVHDALLEALDAEPGLPATPKSFPRQEGES